ncbi:Asp-tRNA(Asn)/Glu-tRNA(Gln) amidotransferase subunit GatC [Candidatus Uhrbacteria bacterium]|nr:Asp-tRNA(Asn)/Glu-tRNA(Gln) amidotransferase subunit GatC [Candidatus Uhrbacteria bacterium]
MALTQKDIDHIAQLGRLECSAEERERFTKQLSSILEYVAQLQEADTAGVEYRYQVDGLENIRNADEVIQCNADVRENVLRAFPDNVGDMLKVKGIFEE